ncbi:hypothetical protein VTO73DRAFT_11063 [Trametes versicolor]
MTKSSHPPSQSKNALNEHPSESPNRVHLSWEPLLPGTSSMDIVVDDSDVHYHFYYEALQHVRTNPHPDYFTCPCATSVSMWTDVFWNGPVQDALKHCQSFGTLINLLMDKFSDIDQLSTEAFLPAGPDSVLNFIAFGVLTVRNAVPLCKHFTCTIRASPGDARASHLYHAQFLDLTILVWLIESRRRTMCHSYPMPWSRDVQIELSRMQASPSDSLPYTTPLLTEDDMPRDEDYDGAMLRSLFGTIIDIPWYGAAHDGFPYCSTMSSYTRIRQPPGACHSRRDDAALWVSALTFGFLEAATRTRIPESMFVVPGPREGEQVLSGSRIHRFLMHFYLSQYRDDNFPEGHLEHGRQIVGLVNHALDALDEEAV